MTQQEVQEQMGRIFEEMKTLEVKLQNTKSELEKALHQEEVCSDGLEEANKRLKACKGQDVVKLNEFADIKSDVQTVDRFREQSQSSRLILQATLSSLGAMQKQLQGGYDRLGIQLARLEHNVLNLFDT